MKFSFRINLFIFFIFIFIFIVYCHNNKLLGGRINNYCNKLDKIYKNAELYGTDSDTNYNTTYGEIECNSIDNIFKNLVINNNDIIYDLGSGGGKFLIYIYLKYKLNCVGIEIIKKRHNKALEIFKKFKNKKQNNTINFINDDFFKSDFPRTR